MYIFHERELIYVRVPRTGSTSFIASVPGAKRIARMHATAVEGRPNCDPDIWDSYKKIAFVRDPALWVQAQYKDHRSGHVKLAQFKNRILPLEEFIEHIPMTPYSWMMDGDELLVDEIYRLEDLDDIMVSWGLKPQHRNKGVWQKVQLDDAERRALRIRFHREYEHYR